MTRLYLEVSKEVILSSSATDDAVYFTRPPTKIKESKTLLLFKRHGKTIFVTSTAHHERKVRSLSIAFIANIMQTKALAS